MKIGIIIIFIFLIACSKDNAITSQAGVQYEMASSVTEEKIPINDLGKGKFHGYTGGLYPDGLNRPAGQYAIDLKKVCSNIQPLDTFGNPSSENGKILFVSMGWSTCGQNMRALKLKTVDNPLTNPELSLITFTSGGGLARLNNIMVPDDPYWDIVAERVKNEKVSFRQVQIIYLETEDSTDNVSFPGRPVQVKLELQSCFRVFKQKFPNVKLVYLLARTTTFGNQYVYSTEPCPYYFGWACKWAIEDQINGVHGTEYKGTNSVSPMITWGFYQWATATPRKTDGFAWSEDLTKDGLHGNDIGKDTLSTRFQKFLLTDRFAKNWYAK